MGWIELKSSFGKWRGKVEVLEWDLKQKKVGEEELELVRRKMKRAAMERKRREMAASLRRGKEETCLENPRLFLCGGEKWSESLCFLDVGWSCWTNIDSDVCVCAYMYVYIYVVQVMFWFELERV